MSSTSLLGSTSRIETPFIKVTIGAYTFGIYNRTESEINENGFYREARIEYPNYLKQLSVKKINGQVNTYNLQLTYPIRAGDDPNFFEKVFSSVSRSRKIIFSYGDVSLPQYIYKDEEAIINKVSTSFNIEGSTISYNVEAVSSAALGKSGVIRWEEYPNGKKPSDLIKKCLYDKTTGLLDLFYGMADRTAVEMLGLIPGNDKAVPILSQTMSPLDYIKYLVGCMEPSGTVNNQVVQKDFYVLTIHDEVIGETTVNAVTEHLGGPYFKIDRVNTAIEKADAYDLDIGYPTHNIVTSFSVNNNENYSIYFDWQSKINPSEYKSVLNSDGQWEEVYSPAFSSANQIYTTTTEDKVWWTKATQYPIKATVTIKGLLRPATLMEYVNLNVYFFGAKHLSSGLYIVTQQEDNIGENTGYRTTLSLTRVKGIEL